MGQHPLDLGDRHDIFQFIIHDDNFKLLWSNLTLYCVGKLLPILIE